MLSDLVMYNYNIVLSSLHIISSTYLKHTQSKSALSNCIDGITEEADKADMWERYYEQLSNDSFNKTSKMTDLNSFGNVLGHIAMQVTMKEILKIVYDLPNGKSSGYDGFKSESSKHADPLH